MAAKHTPGPWLAASRPSSILGWPIVATREGTAVASVHWQPGLPPEVEAEIAANVALLAQGPTMLAALKVAEDFMSGFEDDEMQEGLDEKLHDIREAIAAAEGA